MVFDDWMMMIRNPIDGNEDNCGDSPPLSSLFEV